MDSYAFVLALLPTVVALIALWKDHERSNREHVARSTEQERDRIEKKRERRLALMQGFLDKVHASRVAVRNLHVAAYLGGKTSLLELEGKALFASVDAAKRDLQAAFDTLCLLEQDDVAKPSAKVVRLLQKLLEAAKEQDEGETYSSVSTALDDAESSLRSTFRIEFAKT